MFRKLRIQIYQLITATLAKPVLDLHQITEEVIRSQVIQIQA